MDSTYKPTKEDKKDDKNKACNMSNYEDFVTHYRSIIGSCMYAQMLTRPDIGYSVSKLSKYLNAPTHAHMKQALRMLTYLYHTRDRSITYGNINGNHDNNCSIEGWSDSDHAGDIDTRYSHTGWLFMCYWGPISWRSFQQGCVALCTAEAEYMAISDAAKEARSLIKLAKEMIDNNTTLININGDNKASQLWCKQPSHASKTKQIDVCFHHIRDEINKKRIKVTLVPSKDNISDILTKALGKVLFDKHSQVIFNM
jgi:hypothetical protein